MKTAFWSLVVTFSLAAAGLADTRTWTDSTGRFSVEASLEEVRDDEVILKRADGTLITVPRARLGAADRRYLSALSAPARDKPVTGTDRSARLSRSGRDAVPDQIGKEAITRALAFLCSYDFNRTPLSRALRRR